jgi:prepilin-type N-terminal cleavage/methylation domain-containing protein
VGGLRAVRTTTDHGFSLMETVVTMAVMSIVTAVFTVGIQQLYAAQNRTEAVSSATGQINTAFVRLDRDVRYSSGISQEGAGSSGFYVEYVITNTGTTICNQLRFTLSGSTYLLQSRRKVGTTATTGWSTLASGLSQALKPGTTNTLDPFFDRVDASSSGQAYQQLEVRASAAAGGTGRTHANEADFTFTALNTSPSTTSDSVCSSLGRP